MLTIPNHLVQVLLILIDTLTFTNAFFGRYYGVITNGCVMHQHTNIADGIVMMADDAELTDREGIVESLADLDDKCADARTSDDAIASAEFMRIAPATKERMTFLLVTRLHLVTHCFEAPPLLSSDRDITFTHRVLFLHDQRDGGRVPLEA